MRLGTLLVVAALMAAPACGGGGGGGTGGSPGPLSASFVPDQPTPGANTVAMEQGAKASDVITINVTLTNTSGVSAVAFDATYDGVHATYLGYSAGTAMEQGGNTPLYTVSNSVTNGNGRIVVGVARTGGTSTNISGTVPVKVIGLQFRVTAAGTFPTAIQNEIATGSGQTPLAVTWFAGALKAV